MCSLSLRHLWLLVLPNLFSLQTVQGGLLPEGIQMPLYTGTKSEPIRSMPIRRLRRQCLGLQAVQSRLRPLQ